MIREGGGGFKKGEGQQGEEKKRMERKRNRKEKRNREMTAMVNRERGGGLKSERDRKKKRAE